MADEPRDVVEMLDRFAGDIAKGQAQYALAASLDRTPGEYHVPAADVMALMDAFGKLAGAAKGEIERLREGIDQIADYDWRAKGFSGDGNAWCVERARRLRTPEPSGDETQGDT